MANNPSVSGMIDPAMPKMPDEIAAPVAAANSAGFGAVVIAAIRVRSTYAEWIAIIPMIPGNSEKSDWSSI